MTAHPYSMSVALPKALERVTFQLQAAGYRSPALTALAALTPIEDPNPVETGQVVYAGLIGCRTIQGSLETVM